jgi:ankyrin repeat protein
LLKHPKININVRDSAGRSPLHMAVWGKYGGKLKKKASIHPTDFPEGCELLLNLGANANIEDEYGTCPLATACGSGGDRCIHLLMNSGANINH